MEEEILNAVLLKLQETDYPSRYDTSSLYVEHRGNRVYWGSWYVCRFGYTPSGLLSLFDWAKRFAA